MTDLLQFFTQSDGSPQLAIVKPCSLLLIVLRQTPQGRHVLDARK